MSVHARMRHTKSNPCAVCGGADGDPRGQERRCFGWTTEDGAWVHCSRDELAGAIATGPDDCYAHRMGGPCRCGQTHAGPARAPPRDGPRSEDRPRDIVATYAYADEQGTTLYEVVRYAPKTFRQRRADGEGGWIWSLQDTRRVLYRLPDLLGDESDRPVYIVEGEKDVDALAARGYLATCNPGGAGKWGAVAELARTTLRGRVVRIVQDSDSVGEKHAQEVWTSLREVCPDACVLACPAPHKDVSDLLFAGGKIEQLVAPGKAPSKAMQLAPVLPFDELWTPEPDAQLVIPGLGIAPGPTHLVTGTWYTGKTLLLATMGLCVASGKWLFGLHQTKRGKWAHFDHEMGRRHIKRYLQRLRRGLSIEVEDLRGRIDMHVLPQLNLCTPGAFDMYCELLEGVDFATIDPLRAAAPGADENKSEFRAYLDLLSQVSDRTRCSIVVLHHGGKPGMQETQRRNTGRGTSAIDDAAQSKWVLSAEEKGAPMLVTHEKSRELNELMADFYLKIDNSEPGAVRLTHLEVDQVTEAQEKGRSEKELAKIAKAKVRIRETFAKYAGRLTGIRKDLVQLIGGERSIVEKALTEMISTLEVEKEVSRSGVQILTVFVWKGERV